jgi:rhamnosyltransferase
MSSPLLSVEPRAAIQPKRSVTRDEPPISIIMRSYNEGWALRDTLPALRAQDYKNWELIVIDSGSTDGSVDLIRHAKPAHFLQIKKEEYNPSRVMNYGMKTARSEFGIFLNADATPQGNNWLRPLVMALQDPKVAAAFGRQIPRPDCQAVFAHDYERCFGANRESTLWDHFFSMVSSGLRKDVWSRRGFLEKMQYSEDDEYTRWCREHGFEVVYVPESVVMHSHNYTPQQAYRRSFGEAKALAAVWNDPPTKINFPKTVVLGWTNDARRDLIFCARQKRLGEWPHAARIRWQQRKAKLAGFREGWNHYRNGSGSSPRAEAPLHPPRRIESPPNQSSETAMKFPPLPGGEGRGENSPNDSRIESLNRSAVRANGASHHPPRFTLDGSDALEKHLAHICQKVLGGVRALIPENKLEALVLGGGYGRGQGGVLKNNSSDAPYNDLEFYVFLRGNRVLNERKFHASLEELGERLSGLAGLHIEFKVDSLKRLRRSPVTMFSYDLVSGHRIFFGGENVFNGCEHHLDAAQIPPAEATRLLFNRCTGLLLAKQLLKKREFTPEDADFVGRNLAKAKLALGDVILAQAGRYHWSCLERKNALRELTIENEPGWLEEVRKHHAAGVEFKLHPERISKSLSNFQAEHERLSRLANQVWLWLESRRLWRSFPTARDYAFSRVRKCGRSPVRYPRPQTVLRNILLNARSFGIGGVLHGGTRYPRERLLNALPLLLWEEPLNDFRVKYFLQKELRTGASDWQGLVAAYQAVWPKFS